MGKSIEELFKTKVLVDGKTAAETYEVRNSKDIILRSSTGAMNLPFKAAQILRRNLSSRTRETRLEQEVTGLRIISKLAGPIIYGTDIFKLSTQRTEMVTAMKNSVNPNNASDGILGNLFEKAKQKGLELLSKIGVELPQKLIPTRIALNSQFKSGSEPATMTTLAKIKKDGAGNIIGKFLAQNATGTPKQIGNQILGGGINLAKGEIKKKLFGAAKQGAQNLAKKGPFEVQYDSFGKYSDTVYPTDATVGLRNDLSTVLRTKNTLAIIARLQKLENPIEDVTANPKKVLSTLKNPFAKLGDKLKDIKKESKEKLLLAKKQGQQALSTGKKIGDSTVPAEFATDNTIIKYGDTVDTTADDISLRNDLSTTLLTLKNTLSREGITEPKFSRDGVTKNMYSNLKNERVNKKGFSLKTRYGIESADKLDFLNEKTTYVSNGPLVLVDGTLLDDLDFITLKFASAYSNETVNFRATVSGITETVSPTWDSNKFIGSPFNYYTYSSIERSVSFNFKVYSTTPLQHVAAWQRINFLTGLAYPQAYNKVYAVPPFVKFTLGNLYKNKIVYIESLSYTMDDNAGWEIGTGVATGEKIEINGDSTLMTNYKCPMVVDVAITLKLVESKANTVGGNYYGFDALPRGGSTSATGETLASANAQKFDDANTQEGLGENDKPKPQPVKKTNNPKANKQKTGNKSTPKANKPNTLSKK